MIVLLPDVRIRCKARSFIIVVVVRVAIVVGIAVVSPGGGVLGVAELLEVLGIGRRRRRIEIVPIPDGGCLRRGVGVSRICSCNVGKVVVRWWGGSEARV